MVELYSESNLIDVKKQKNKCLTVFFAVTTVFVACVISLLIYYALEPYGTNKKIPLIIAECVITGLYVIFTYIFMAIKYSRAKKYCNLLSNLIGKNTTKSTVTFMRFSSEVTAKDGVDFSSIIFVEWSEKEKDFMERHVFLDKEKSRPDFHPGDEVNVYTRMNILVGYEIFERTNLSNTPFDQNNN